MSPGLKRGPDKGGEAVYHEARVKWVEQRVEGEQGLRFQTGWLMGRKLMEAFLAVLLSSIDDFPHLGRPMCSEHFISSLYLGAQGLWLHQLPVRLLPPLDSWAGGHGSTWHAGPYKMISEQERDVRQAHVQQQHQQRKLTIRNPQLSRAPHRTWNQG